MPALEQGAVPVAEARQVIMLATITFGEILKVGLFSGVVGFAFGMIFGVWLTFKIIPTLEKKHEQTSAT